MDRLWSPWRLAYVTGAKHTGCVFCLAPASAGSDDASPDADPLILFQGTCCYVILNLYPYNNGHLMVVPYRHVASLAELTSDELAEIGVLTQRCEIVITEAYHPQGINVGINLGEPAGAGVLNHIHVHLVPRWNGDTSFMTVIGEVRIIPEDFNSTAARLRPLFEKLAGA